MKKEKTKDIEIVVGETATLKKRVLSALGKRVTTLSTDYLTVEISTRSNVKHLTISTNASNVKYELKGKRLYFESFVDSKDTVIVISGKVIDTMNHYLRKVELLLEVQSSQEAIKALMLEHFPKYQPAQVGEKFNLKVTPVINVFISLTAPLDIQASGVYAKNIKDLQSLYLKIVADAKIHIIDIEESLAHIKPTWERLEKEYQKAFVIYKGVKW